MSYNKKKKEIVASKKLRQEIYEDVTKEEKERKGRHCLNFARVATVISVTIFYGVLFILFVFISSMK